MRQKNHSKKQPQRAVWTVEPVRPVERDELVEALIVLLDAARRNLVTPEHSIR